MPEELLIVTNASHLSDLSQHPAMGIARKSHITLSVPVATRSSSFALPYCNWHPAQGSSCNEDFHHVSLRLCWTHCMNRIEPVHDISAFAYYGRCLLMSFGRL
jgi:hypothetical protein